MVGGGYAVGRLVIERMAAGTLLFVRSLPCVAMASWLVTSAAANRCGEWKETQASRCRPGAVA